MKTTIVIFPGRFQPFHKDHYEKYKWLVNKFGANKIFIATSNSIDPIKSPLSFKEKKEIINRYGIKNVFMVKNSYQANEITSKYDPKTTAVIFAVGEKDSSRLSSSFFKLWKGKAEIGYNDGAYLLIVPKLSNNELSGTEVRNILGGKLSSDKKKQEFKKIFGWFDEGIFNNLVKKFSIKESKIFSKEWWNIVVEDITLPIKVGDILLGGKFKNRKIKVKKIGKNDKGDITINDKPLLRFRLLKKQDIDELVKKIANEGVLTEGGGHGHVSHPFEDWELTFNDLKNLIELGLSGGLSKQTSVLEKMDGMQLSVSWYKGKLVAARNKSELSGYGSNALSISGIISKFKGRGEISKAFTYAMKDLEKAISSISSKERDKIFKNGKVFLSLEIIWPGTTNVINYDKALLVVHGTQIEYDENGSPIEYIKGAASELVSAIKSVNSHLQKHFEIIEQPVVDLPKHSDFTKKKGYFLKSLNSLKNKFGLKDSDKVALYHQKWWENFIVEKSDSFKYGIPNNILVDLTKRWAFNDKSFPVSAMKSQIKNEKFLQWALEFDKKEHQDQIKKNLWPFEKLFLELGAEILSNLKTFLTASPDKAIQNIKDSLSDTINKIKGSNDVRNINLLTKNLEKLNALGGSDEIIPSEGLIFLYNSSGSDQPKLLKITGKFAILNQLTGLLKYAK